MRLRYTSAAVITVLLLVGCQSNVTNTFPGEKFFREADEVVFSNVADDTGGLEEAQNRVFRNAGAFEQFWLNMHEGSVPVPEIPEIDFENQMVIVAALGFRPNGGYDIEIQKIGIREGTLGVHVVRMEPGKRCGVTLGSEYPIHIVKVAKENTDIKFFEESTVTQCE